MIPSKFLALTVDYAVSGHKPPRPPIDLRPVWPVPMPPTLEEKMFEDMRRVAEVSHGERVWQVVVDIARSTNVAGGVAPVSHQWVVTEVNDSNSFVVGDTADEVPDDAPVGDLWGIDWGNVAAGATWRKFNSGQPILQSITNNSEYPLTVKCIGGDVVLQPGETRALCGLGEGGG